VPHDPRAIADELAKRHRDSLIAHVTEAAEDLAADIRKAIEQATGNGKPRPTALEFFEALRNLGVLAKVGSTEEYMAAWEEFALFMGYDPHEPGPPPEPPTCGPLLQWGEVACRLHGTAITVDHRPVCVVTGEKLEAAGG
jgi:hypothetical protein